MRRRIESWVRLHGRKLKERTQRSTKANSARVDVHTGKVAWELPQVGSGESRSGTLATAAGLAADSSTGKPLWSFRTKQLVALAAGADIIVFGLE